MKHFLLKSTLAVVCLLMSVNVLAASFVADGLTYNILETTDGSNAVEVTYTNSKGGSYSGDIVVPAQVSNEGVAYAVTTIGEKAFYKCTGLTSIVLPEGLTSINKDAFNGCNAITEITLPSTLVELKNYAFNNCKALTGAVIPDGVEVINTYAFYNCIKMTSLTLGEGVKEINSCAFKYCEALKKVTLPKNVSKIASDAFGSCKVMEEYEVAEDNNTFCAVGGILYSKDKATLVKCPMALAGDVTIEAGVQTVENEAFYGCSKLTSVTFPSSVVTLGESAFDGCSSMTSVALNEGLQTIGEYAFDNATALKSIVIPNSVKTIGEYVFYYCMGLESVKLGSGLTSLGLAPFYRCMELKEIEVDAANTAFVSVDGVLFTSDKTTLLAYPNKKAAKYDIPEGVYFIGAFAFYYCDNVTNVTMPNTVMTINKSAFEECEKLETINFSTALQSVGEKAFSYCLALKEVVLPEGLVSVGNMSFNKNTALKSIVLPNSVVTIDEKAFQNCTALKEATLGTGLTTLGKSAFYGCSKLNKIVALCAEVPTTGTGAFNSVPTSTVVVTMPTALVDEYAAITAWNNLIKTKVALDVTVTEGATVEYGVGGEMNLHSIADGTSLFVCSGDPVELKVTKPHYFMVLYNGEKVELDEDNIYLIDPLEENATFEVLDDPTAVEEVSVEENAPVEFYNLHGVKVNKAENGVFIKKQGNKAVKVVL